MSKDFKRVELKIERILESHPFEIGYKGTPAQVKAYNQAIKEVTKKYHLGAFHQTGSESPKQYQAWEMLGSDPSEKELKKIEPEIHRRAEDIFHHLKNLKLLDE